MLKTNHLTIVAADFDGFPSDTSKAEFYLDGVPLALQSLTVGIRHKENVRVTMELECSISTMQPGSGPTPKEELEKLQAFYREIIQAIGDDRILDRWKRAEEAHAKVCQTVAEMHAAAMGQTTGTRRGVVEDVADLRARCLAAEEALAAAQAAAAIKAEASIYAATPAPSGPPDYARPAPPEAVPFSYDLFTHEPPEEMEAPLYRLSDGRTVSVGPLKSGKGYGFAYTRPAPDGKTSVLKFALTDEAATVTIALLQDIFAGRAVAMVNKAQTTVWENAVEEAWGIIANAYGGDWTKASQDWRTAAERWREQYIPAASRNAAERARAASVLVKVPAILQRGEHVMTRKDASENKEAKAALSVSNRHQLTAFTNGLRDARNPAGEPLTYNTAEMQAAYDAGRKCGELSATPAGSAPPAPATTAPAKSYTLYYWTAHPKTIEALGDKVDQVAPNRGLYRGRIIVPDSREEAGAEPRFCTGEAIPGEKVTREFCRFYWLMNEPELTPLLVSGEVEWEKGPDGRNCWHWKNYPCVHDQRIPDKKKILCIWPPPAEKNGPHAFVEPQ